MKKFWFSLRRFSGFGFLCLLGCTGIPDNAEVVNNFELDRYLGTWYEIARMDHRFERGLSNVQAQYSMRDDGGVRVLNRGYNDEKNEWSEAEGRAYFIDSPDTGRLKVSFFGPFYGAYNIIDLDKENYNYAMIIGPDTDYLWILARQPSLDPDVLQRLIDKASKLGVATDGLIFPAHDQR
ncbi:MAG: lipocalin [Gammaproteobacteria bacterium]|nr:lipocalin [Gammaproteobacteria bacterium]